MNKKEEVVVGSLTSNKMGSGARKNAGKLDYSLIYPPHLVPLLPKTARLEVEGVLNMLGEFMISGKKEHLDLAYTYALLCMEGVNEYSRLDDVVRVFDYGTRKYSSFNWMMGMPWSVCMGCIMRHIQKQYIKGEELDTDTGIQHMAHVICNIQMLLFYCDNFRAGNDLPSKLIDFDSPPVDEEGKGTEVSEEALDPLKEDLDRLHTKGLISTSRRTSSIEDGNDGAGRVQGCN